MLCFLPLVVPPPRRPQPPPPPRFGAMAAAWTIIAVVALALLTPFGWVRSRPVYVLRVGIASHFGPRVEDQDLMARLGPAQTTGGRPPYHPAFLVSRDAYDALPPGLVVDGATGALTGTPSMAGTYTLALGVSDGAARMIKGATFKIKVLPAS